MELVLLVALLVVTLATLYVACLPYLPRRARPELPDEAPKGHVHDWPPEPSSQDRTTFSYRCLGDGCGRVKTVHKAGV